MSNLFKPWNWLKTTQSDTVTDDTLGPKDGVAYAIVCVTLDEKNVSQSVQDFITEITVKLVVRTPEEAEAEIERLNGLTGKDKIVYYFSQATRIKQNVV